MAQEPDFSKYEQNENLAKALNNKGIKLEDFANNMDESARKESFKNLDEYNELRKVHAWPYDQKFDITPNSKKPPAEGENPQ